MKGRGQEGGDRGEGTDGSEKESDMTQVADQALNPPSHHQVLSSPSWGSPLSGALLLLLKAPKPVAKGEKRQVPKGQLPSHLEPDRDAKPLSTGWLA